MLLPPLYAITDRTVSGVADVAEIASRLFRVGVRCLQVREKTMADRQLLAVVETVRSLAPAGSAVLVNDRVEAFSCGERLNESTAVIHLEKANPELRGLYAVINQQFCREAWAGVPFINREQDLGEPGLRTAKLSYHPHRLVEKYHIRLR